MKHNGQYRYNRDRSWSRTSLFRTRNAASPAGDVASSKSGICDTAEFATSIFVYENERVQSLEEAIKPVEHLFENIEKHVCITKQKSEQLKEGLTTR